MSTLSNAEIASTKASNKKRIRTVQRIPIVHPAGGSLDLELAVKYQMGCAYCEML
jgi:hypothetical protein